MARIRTVKPEFFAHEGLASCPFSGRLLAIGLLQLADGKGRLRWIPKQIEAHVFPFDVVDLDTLAIGLEEIGYLVRYEIEGRLYASIPNFGKHQRITGKEAEYTSRIPEYSSDVSQGNEGETPERFPGKQRDAQEHRNRGTEEHGTDSLVGTVPVPSVDVGPDDTRTIPASTPRQEPIPALRPGPAVKADPVADVWAGWRDCNPTARTAPTAKQRTAIKARLTEHTVEALRAYFRWVRESPHPRATYCRENGHDGFESVMRPGHVDERAQWVKAWLAGEDQRQRAKGAAAIANYTSEAYTPDDDADPMGYGQRVVIDCDRSEHPPIEACPNCGRDLPVEWSAAFGWWRRETCCEVVA